MKRFSELEILVLEKGVVSCNDVEALLGEYADGELLSAVREKIDSHCESCEECAQMRDEYLLTIRLAQTLSDKPLPVDVHNRLRNALNEKLGLSLPELTEETSKLQ